MYGLGTGAISISELRNAKNYGLWYRGLFSQWIRENWAPLQSFTDDE